MVKINKAIFFDRDGTLIKTFVSKRNIPKAIKNLKDFKLLNNVKFVVNKLAKKYKIIVITNQPDVSRGKNSKILYAICYARKYQSNMGRQTKSQWRMLFL